MEKIKEKHARGKFIVVIDLARMDLMVYRFVDAAFGETVHHDDKGYTGVYIKSVEYEDVLFAPSSQCT